MLAKRTAKNQITLPKSLVARLGDPEHFDVTVEGGRLVLTPVHVQGADAVREKLADLGVDEAEVEDAVTWARRGE